ncbi:Oligoendopeptidase F [Clostridiaceae bacterium JG1575]|nr:Oligoendopeptidase F [Clostridiaceae bacterium JG1575]
MDHTRWNLEILYKGFEDSAIAEDFDRLEASLKDFSLWSEKELSQGELTREKIKIVLDRQSELLDRMQRLSHFMHLNLAVDTGNKAAQKGQERIRSYAGEWKNLQVLFSQALKNCEDLEALIESDPFLKEHAFYLREQKKKADHLLSKEEEVLLARLRNTGSLAFQTLQGDLLSRMMIPVDLPEGSTALPLPALRNLAYHQDPEVRKRGYLAELSAYPEIGTASSACLSAIKGEVLTTSRLRGFDHPLEETLLESRMTKKTLDALLLAIQEALPDFRRYLLRKAELLGHTQGLPFYDLFAPMGDAEKTYSYDEAMEYLIETFRPFSQELSDYIECAYQGRWLDVEPRMGKRGGAFCLNLRRNGESRILANFDGSFSNMTTLAHELGHGYHGYQLRDEAILNTSYPMPIAETASIFNETLIENAAIEKAQGAERIGLLEASLQGATQVIVDIYSRFLFEDRVFTERAKGPLGEKELKEIMLWAQEKSYGEALDPKFRHPYMWINKPHYYNSGLSYYNFPYAFGLLFAKGLYALSLEEGADFLPRYQKLLAKTGKKDLKQLTQTMGIDIESPDFFRKSLGILRRMIEEFLAATKEGARI